MSRSARWLRVATVTVLAAGALSTQAFAAVRTTNPQAIRNLHVVLTGRGAQLSLKQVARGSLVRFFVRNMGTKPTDFFIGGYFVHQLKPGLTRNFQLQFLERGHYSYFSAAHPGKKIKGVLIVT